MAYDSIYPRSPRGSAASLPTVSRSIAHTLPTGTGELCATRGPLAAFGPVARNTRDHLRRIPENPLHSAARPTGPRTRAKPPSDVYPSPRLNIRLGPVQPCPAGSRPYTLRCDGQHRGPRVECRAHAHMLARVERPATREGERSGEVCARTSAGIRRTAGGRSVPSRPCLVCR